MAKASPTFEGLIDAGALRAELTALTSDRDGDGSSSDVRKEALAVLKAASANSRAHIRSLLDEDGGGMACARRLSYLQDEIIRVIYDFAVTHVFRSSNPSASEQMAVLAVGGYGRGTLAPGSDLDLLFALPHKQTAWGESVVEYILYMLWDMGFKVGHATRTLDECIRLSRDDMTIRTSVLESRFLWGEQSLHDELVERFDNEVMEDTAPEFIAAKLAERNVRHEKAGRSRYLVEPNVKEGKGGLRDLHTLYWIAKYHYRVRTHEELVKAGVFSRKEYNRFAKAQDFLWAVRCHMHFLTGRSEERLSFDLQPELADRLGYSSHPGMSAVERFMKHYFLVAKDVGDLTRIFCAALEEQQAMAAPGLTGMVRKFTRRSRKIRGTSDFVNQNGRINVAGPDVFERDPVNLLRIFDVAEKNDLLFHPDAMQLVTRSLKLIDKKLRQDPEANEAFMNVLTSPKTPEANLRKMNESGVLGRFIPDFGKIVAMMQFNMYHHYTVDEHLLRSIGILAEIEHHELGEEHPLANELIEQLPDRKILYVALLLHDIAKGRPEDHSIAGARIARKLCPRLGFNAAQTVTVSWLVEHHLEMSSIAQSRDLNDPKTIADFADSVQSLERLRFLLVLTVCDIKAVGPGVWNGWKGQLLRTLYYETEPVLSGGFTQSPRRQRVAERKEELASALASWSEADRKRIIGLHYSAYLLSVRLEDQVRHAEFIREADRAGKPLATTISTRAFEAITEITVLAPDHPRLLSIIAGACAAAGANIADAKIYTTADGRALDSIFINREFDNDADEHRRAERIAALIEELLSGRKRLPQMIAERTRQRRVSQAFKVPPVVSIDNTLSEKFSVVTVEGLDRPGILSELTNAISDLNLDIASAHIATFGEKIMDAFYVTDLTGQKIERPQRLTRIRERLLDLFRTEDVPKPGKGGARPGAKRKPAAKPKKLPA